MQHIIDKIEYYYEKKMRAVNKQNWTEAAYWRDKETTLERKHKKEIEDYKVLKVKLNKIKNADN